MNILKAALYTSLNEYTGIGNYTRQLLFAMHTLGYSEIEAIHGTVCMDKHNFMTKVVSGLHRIYVEQMKIPYILKNNKVALYHNTQNLGMPMCKICPFIVTIHDIVPLIYPRQYLPSAIERFVYEYALEISIKQADYIITDSNFSKDELIKHTKVNPEKVKVIYLGYNNHLVELKNIYGKVQICQKYGITKPYIMTIGGTEYRKNIPRLIEVFQCQKMQDFQLVIVGRKDHKYVCPNIISTGQIHENDLAGLYNYADVFVFPSFYEGFGLPVLEAMSIGTPVLTSRASSLPEVGGDAAVYFDPFDIYDIRQQLCSVLFDEDLKKDMVQNGYVQIQKFSWDKCARQTIDVYKKVLHNK